MKILGIIPARYASSRFPGKPLQMIGDKSMIQRVYLQAQKADLITKVIVATDDQRIFDHVKAFGGAVKMTGHDHLSGTTRCIEVAASFSDFEVFVNIQGDEPFIHPSQLDSLVRPFLNNPALNIATLAKKIQDQTALTNPNVVKVVFGQQLQALYFSRHPIPFNRNQILDHWLNDQEHYKHLGVYAFNMNIRDQLKKLHGGRLYQIEQLEQLQWLEHGMNIQIILTEKETIGIDTPEDLENAIRSLKSIEVNE